MQAAISRANQAKSESAPAPTTTSTSAPSVGALNRSAAPALSLSSVLASPGKGVPLLAPVRATIERSTRGNLASVRVHQDPRSALAVDASGARAVAHGNNIFLGSRESPADLALMAHEAAHVLQQRGAPAGPATQKKTSAGSSESLEGEADRVSHAAQAGQPVTVQGRTSGPQPQFSFLDSIVSGAKAAASAVADAVGDVIGFALDYIKPRVSSIPGFRMFTIIIGVNPIDMSRVDPSAANILRAIVEFMPGGTSITDALDNHGIFDKVGSWVELQIKSLGIVGSAVKEALTTFLKSLQGSDIGNLGGVWDRAKRIFSDPIDKIIAFAKQLVSGIIQLIKDAILRPIAKLAEGTEGYNLLKAVLGKDPVTDDPYPPTAENVIGPILKLIGQGEIWENMKKSNAIGRAWAWFKGAMSALKGFVSEIPGLFISAFKSLVLMDIILVPRAFQKLANVFGGFLGRFSDWALDAIWKLLEIIFDAVKPGAFDYVKRTGAALKSILKNPIPFVGNLVKAGMLGFQNFSANFFTHLKAGLLDWLTGSLPGVYIPTAISLVEVGKFALSVFGITWAQIRGKFVKAIGDNGEKIMSGLEKVFPVVSALVTGGPAAAWEVIKDQLTSLKDTVIGGITDFVVDTVVQKAIPKIVAMFIPGVGFIPAIVSIYDTIMVFVQKLTKIGQVIIAFVDSIIAIASGNIAAAAKRVESVLAGLLSLAISFLAGFVGLNKVSDKIKEVLEKVRKSVDKAIEGAANWIVAKAKSLFKKLFGKKDKPDERTDAEKLAALNTAIAESETLLSDGSASPTTLSSKLSKIQKKHKLTTLELQSKGKDEYRVYGAVNPDKFSKDSVILGDNYTIKGHTATEPTELSSEDKKAGGESHHVPVQVMKMWFGKKLREASASAQNNTLKKALGKQAKYCESKKDGAGLSAIWLRKADHVDVHGAEVNIPVEIKITYKDNRLATKPRQTNFDLATPDLAPEKNPNTEKLRSAFKSVFNSMLSIGLAALATLKLKPKGWKLALSRLAPLTWESYLKVPDKKDE